MKHRIFYWLIYLGFCTLILFVMCALPWYGTLAISAFYAILAVPGTLFASIICGEAFLVLNENLEDTKDDETDFD